MKKRNVLLFFLLLFPSLLFSAESAPKSVDQVMNEIRSELSLKSDGKIDPSKVSPKMLEELGDAVMEEMIGDSEAHERMDQRMGGEGSQSLSAMHQRIGFNYLSGGPLNMMWPHHGFYRDNFGRFGMMGMMGGYPYPGMMGWGWGGMFIGFFLFIITLVVIAFLIKWIIGQKAAGSESAMEILKKRYAKGEISKEEFDKMKNDLF